VDTGKIIGIVRSLLYFAAGIFFVVSAASPSWVRLFGIIAIAYGAFRLYQSLKRDEKEEEDDES
jgi:ABC-type polysaccharide/polyol phosphate export permease